MILKKSYIRDRINSLVINFIFKFCKFENNGKILVKSMDGIGDILVRSRVAEKIIEKYGKENVYFLMKDHYKNLGEFLEYNVIGIPRKSEKSFFKRLKMMYEINKKYSPKKFLNIEFGNDSIVANIVAEDKIGVRDNSQMAQCYNGYYTESFLFRDINEKILDKIKDIGINILDNNLKLDDILPDLRDKFPIDNKDIVIAVGSTARNRVCSPLKMKEYIEEIFKIYPEEKIILVGNGNLQKEYAKKIIELLPNKKIIDFVDKTNLMEAFELVTKSKLFVGFESGLYNLCFVTRKKGIGLFRDTSVPFAHEVPWLKNIGPSEKIDISIKDEDYPDERINSISVESFKKALEELK
ncbi:glycosyltransferase family 9 protein [Fusobacterium sp.]|uniref:glycosyltransferase family 9 protein n=1 Tax=Fusobacterium sp. TaxID=68766 RepID=UPI002639E9F1|nr:glycosyltransferase family 9 protein [Fusobacterium sp.]